MVEHLAENDHLSERMGAYQSGELAAFEEIYKLLKPRLLQYLAAQTLNRVHAEDLLQETFLQVHRSRNTYLPGRPVTPWVFAIARHVYLMDRRSKTRRLRHETLSDTDQLPELPTPPEVESLADVDSLRLALTRVPPERREALLMHHVWGFSFKEIGSVLGIRRGTAKLRAHRGMLALRAAIGENS